MNIQINASSRIVTSLNDKPLQYAIENLYRDIGKVCSDTDQTGSNIMLVYSEKPLIEASYRISTVMESEGLTAENLGNIRIEATDTLGFIYALYHISREILRIHDFWFWNDQVFTEEEAYEIPSDYYYESEPYAVKLRGWFVNDEVLLHKWTLDGDKDQPWEMVFETLLRLGGNMIIPGTDKNSVRYRQMASDRGLYITHHHAEPLGAEMFSRAYPDLKPSIDEHPEKFQSLWQEGIQRQKDLKVVWNLGFRGQGDHPFWVNDPRYATDEARGGLISDIIKKQYHMVKALDPQAACCTNLYGETMELYSKGHLSLPEDVIKIWADNGFGKMVSRRQENHNPRVVALPKEQDHSSHGIYYHVSFYDLQAANHMTLLPNSPEFVLRELKELLRRQIHDYWIINCSNIKPHIYYLVMIAKLWRAGDVQLEEHRQDYVASYYGLEYVEGVSQSLIDYHRYAVAYGEHEDDHAGEQFPNYGTRMLVSQYMKDKNQKSDPLLWATGDVSLKEQIDWYQKICQEAAKGYESYVNECRKISSEMTGPAQQLYEDSLLLQALMLKGSYQGAYQASRSLQYAMEGDYKKAFFLAGQARASYALANEAMGDREHGKWHKFYENECLTDIKLTGRVLGGLMAYLRNMDDGPHFFRWQREFMYSDQDRQITLITNMDNHPTDDEIYDLMRARWDA